MSGATVCSGDGVVSALWIVRFAAAAPVGRGRRSCTIRRRGRVGGSAVARPKRTRTVGAGGVTPRRRGGGGQRVGDGGGAGPLIGHARSARESAGRHDVRGAAAARARVTEVPEAVVARRETHAAQVALDRLRRLSGMLGLRSLSGGWLADHLVGGKYKN